MRLQSRTEFDLRENEGPQSDSQNVLRASKTGSEPLQKSLRALHAGPASAVA